MTKHTTNLMALSLFLALMGANTTIMAAGATFSAPHPIKQKNKPPNKKLLMPFQQIGVIRDLNIPGRNIIVSGTRYYYDINTKFQSSQSKFLSIQSFNKGDRVGISYVSNNNKRLLTSIWVLPTNLVLPLSIEH